MAVYCALDNNTAVLRWVHDVEGIAGEIVCLECDGSGWWDYGPPDMPGLTCPICKGSGKQLVSL